MKRRWVYSRKKIDELKQDSRLTGISDVVLHILLNRGYDTPEKIEKFLFSSLDDLHDTRLMKDADKAVQIMKEAIENNEMIVNYSDYDSDGVESAVVMTSLLRTAGGNVDYYTNNRFKQGYGMMPSGVDAILEKYPDVKLIVTTDNGIMAHEGVQYAIDKGIKVVITDHHEQGKTLPNAHAIVDPKRIDCEYPFKGLCGAGVAFKLMLLLYWEMDIPLKPVYDMLDVVALATVGDIVPIEDENRIIVQEGLKLVNDESRVRKVFKLLQEITNVKEVNAHYTFGFIYVPMINAIGRLDGDPRRAIDMFFSDDDDEIRETILYLQEVNNKRKQMTVDMCVRAEEIIAEKGLQKVIVVSDDSFHEGIVGLIAGRLKEKYNRPAIAFTKDHHGNLKGSARSIDGYHLKKAFDELHHSMLGGGGHAKAGGLTIGINQLADFEKYANELADSWLTEEDFVRKYYVDAILDAQNIDIEVVDDLRQLEPFGESFSVPTLVLNNFTAQNVFFMGNEKQHVKLASPSVSLIMWNQADNYKQLGQPKTIRCIGFPELNIYKGNISLQFKVDGENYIVPKSA